MIANYYSVLEIEKDSNIEIIKKAFRKQIALYHPENNKNPDARIKFDNLIEAFNVLSNPEKRKVYDKILEKQNLNLPTVISQKEEKTYKEWQKEAKKKSKKSWETDLSDLLLLDIFFELGMFGIFDGIGDVLGDSLGDVFDLF